MSVFPETSATLLARLAAQATGEDEAAWARFFELYEPAIVQFVRLRGFGKRGPVRRVWKGLPFKTEIVAESPENDA